MSLTTARGVDYRERLGAGPATLGDATAGLGLSKSAITRHVKVLGETGVLTRAVEGRTHVLSPGHNAFIREGERIYRTYFIDSRGDEAMGTTWSYLDMAPLGRQEDWEDSPEDYPQLFELTKA